MIRTFIVFCFFSNAMGFLNANPIIFSQRYTADAAVIVYDGRVYVYGSHDVKGQDGFKMDGYTCFSSDDLLNWTDHGEVLKADQIPYVDHFWAPQAIYSEANNKFYLYFCQDHIGTGVVESDSPLGPWTDVRGSLLMEGHRVDVGVFIDDDGTPYAYWPGGIVKKLKQNMYEFEDGEWNVWNNDAHEAPYVRKFNGRYYYMYMTFNDQELWSCAQFNIGCEDKYPWANFFHRYHFLESPTGPIIEPTSIHGRTMTWPLVGDNTHPAIFNFYGQYYSLYHGKLLQVKRNEPGFHRNIGLDRIYFEDDGHIIPQAVTQEGLKQVKFLNPFIRQEAETIGRENGIQTEPSTDNGGGRMVTQIATNDWIRIFGADFGSGATSFEARVASPAPATMEVRLDSVNGRTVAVLQVPDTGGLDKWQTVTTSVSGAEGVHDIYFVFTLGGFHFNWWKFSGSQPSGDIPPPVVKRVSLKSLANDLFVSATESHLIADAAGVLENQEFNLIDNEDGTYSLFSLGTNKFVTADDGLKATRNDNNTDAERFLLMHTPNGSYCLFSQSGKSYVYAPDNASHPLTTGVDQPWKDPHRSVSRFWINYLDVPSTKAVCTGESRPWKYHVIPGIIQAEDFDISCTEPAYYDNSSTNSGNSYRPDDSVDIRPTRDTVGSYDIFNIFSGEWISYTVFAEDSGYYEFSARFSATSGGHQFYVEAGNSVSAMIEINQTGTASDYREFVGSVFLAGGKQTFKVVFNKATRGLNFNHISFVKLQDATGLREKQPHNEPLLFPNPAERQFTIKHNSTEIQKVTVVDMLGNVVFIENERFVGARIFDVSKLAAGNYIVHIELENNRLEKKIIKL